MSRIARTLTRQELLGLAVEVAGTRTQEEMAAALGVSQPAISLALRDSDKRRDRLRIRLIHHYSTFRIEVREVILLTDESGEEKSS